MKREFDEYDDDKFDGLEEYQETYAEMAPLVCEVGRKGRQLKTAMAKLAPLMEQAFPTKFGAVIHSRMFKKWLRDGMTEENEKHLFEQRAKKSSPFSSEELKKK